MAVNGALTPSAIPDRVAYRHFIVATIVSSDDHLSVGRQQALLRNVDLSSADQAALVQLLAHVAQRLRKLDTMSPSFKNARATALDEARCELETALTSDGANRLQRYIDGSVKPRIKIHGEIPK